MVAYLWHNFLLYGTIFYDIVYVVPFNLWRTIMSEAQEYNVIRDKVIKIVVEQLGVSDDISDDASFVADLGADSLDTVELVMALEESFAMEIPD